MTAPGILTKFMQRVRSVLATFAEKPHVRLDDYVLEHFLLYHGLVGTSPENQKSFRDVRADIIEATKRRSSVEMAIALKLPPLWWEDKLLSIFAELDRNAAIDCLLPQGSEEEIPSSADPLRNEDWHVQANAARILAFLQCKESTPKIVRSLNSAAREKSAAFCHLALALGTLGSDDARTVLETYLYDNEPWFRVDVANALAGWPVETTGQTLAAAMMSYHNLSDYMAVMIGKKQSVSAYLAASTEELRAGGEELVVGVLSASHSTFPPDIVTDTAVDECWPQLLELFERQPSPRVTRALLMLANWLDEHEQHPGWLPQARRTKEELPQRADVQKMIVEKLNAGSSADGDLRAAIMLAGDLRIEQSTDGLTALLQPDFVFLNETIDALGSIGNSAAAPALISLSKKLVDQNSRSQLAPSKQPVDESQPEKARSYWHALRALRHLPHAETISFLMAGTNDFAPDKRQQSLESLIEVYPLSENQSKYLNQLEDTTVRLLEDPSTPVRLAALEGVSKLQITRSIDEVVRLCDARESSLSKKAFQTLEELHRHGHKGVVDAVESRLKREHNSYKRRQLEDFLRPLR